MKFLDVFNPVVKGSHGLTDEAAYTSIKKGTNMIPLYGGNVQHVTTERYVSAATVTVDGTNIRIFSGEGIILSLDGSAGSMTYKNGETFTLNHHAGFITLKEGGKSQVNLEFFSLFMKNHYQALSVSDGSKTLSLNQLYSEDFILPPKATQDRIMKSLGGILQASKNLDKLYNKAVSLLNKEISVNYEMYQGRNIRIDTILGYISGNSGLTEEFLYNNIELQGPRYKILSSATKEENMLGEIPMCTINGRQLKVFEDREGLLVIRKGKAGNTYFLTPGKYTLNDDAYILFVKDNCRYQIHLKWLSIQYRSDFLAYASSSDNGTWNMTGFFSNVAIDIPSYKEQLKVVRMYEKAENFKMRIELFQQKMETLLSKEIS
ncbi:MAG: restriction endonuclease subunit S [Bacteroidaceae bacterium]|nr:restriction endonuclease subunit S [Bacteroidaceae bacterium]